MKSIRTIIGACLLVLGITSLASCSQEEDYAGMQEKSNLLKICTDVADTRNVITGTTFQKGDQIGLWVTTADGHDYTGYSRNIRAVYTGTDWQLEREVELTDEEAIVYAYYPYDENATDSLDIDLTSGYMNQPGQTDFLYGRSQGVSINNTTANIQFNHALARVTLAIKKGVDDVGEGVISRVRIENDLMYYSGHYAGERPTKRDTKIATRGKMSIKTGERRNITSEEDYFVEVPVNCTINTSESQDIDILLLPVSYSSIQSNTWSGGGISAVLTIDGEEYRFPIKVAPSSRESSERVKVPVPSYAWKAGQQYTYPITINRQTAHIPETVGKAVYMGFDGDNGKPLYWSSWNLGASAPEEDGGYYGWGDPTGKHTEQWIGESYGNYMEDKDACLAFYGGAKPLSNICDTEFDVAKAKWGSGWRLPSRQEFERLIDNCIITTVIQNGVEGCLFTSKVNNNTLFFPKTSGRLGEKEDMPGWGGYWAGTGLTTLAEWADVINLGDLNTGHLKQKCIGCSVRPVTEQP